MADHERKRPAQPELARVLEAEERARLLLEAAAEEARRLEEEARRRAEARVESARRSQGERRQRVREELVTQGEAEAERILAEAALGRERDAARAERARASAEEAVLALLRAEAS